MLGRKQSVRNNEDWKNALDHIEEAVSKKELDSLVKKTVKDIKEKCKGKKAAYAWSAGKDSLVLGEICEKAGIDQSVLVRCNLEYPAFIAWIEQNKPSGLEVINTGQDMEWLKKHPDMLFPDKSSGFTLYSIEDRRDTIKNISWIYSCSDAERQTAIMLEKIISTLIQPESPDTALLQSGGTKISLHIFTIMM